MTTDRVGKSISTVATQEGAALHQFHPAVALVDGVRYFVWPADFAGDLVSLGLAALGFDVRQEGDRYLVPLDASTGDLLQRLHHLAVSLRWQQRCDLFAVVEMDSHMDEEDTPGGEVHHG